MSRIKKIRLSKPTTLIALAALMLSTIGLIAATIVTATPAYADNTHNHNNKNNNKNKNNDKNDNNCNSSDQPQHKDLPDASGATGNPHTCQQPTGDPHDDPENPSEGNPHNSD